eukprot:CAMPEP_0174309632 /NCGR_PEP_ID=MMETSP0810-20121108/2539_1 /TAXON_ID=73025 ORGANISM="Eutreptiella gymnastica-like, Strain CCMP1594" /NCGR_SAMPLE_ID=MMETSP0810 /ASSEMBLY_ACC=CAM_ASM_000659 /LENGTH=129 /DNA_ID=CAMNT_0015417329 /DNA_START=543 /DNA_END=928 /DNA_ORIENTATION=+
MACNLPKPLLATHPLQTLGTVPTACFLWAPVLKAMRRAVCSVGHGVGEVPLTATANPHPGTNRVSTGWSSCRGYQVVVALHRENAAQLSAHRLGGRSIVASASPVQVVLVGRGRHGCIGSLARGGGERG